jgi:hypothetical protein
MPTSESFRRGQHVRQKRRKIEIPFLPGSIEVGGGKTRIRGVPKPVLRRARAASFIESPSTSTIPESIRPLLRDYFSSLPASQRREQRVRLAENLVKAAKAQPELLDQGFMERSQAVSRAEAKLDIVRLQETIKRESRRAIGEARKLAKKGNIKAARQAMTSARNRAYNIAAEQGWMEHPNAPHDLTAVIGDLIPDEPWEIAATAGTLGLGRTVSAGAEVGQALTAVRDTARGVSIGAKAFRRAGGLRTARALGRGSRLTEETIAKLPKSARTVGRIAKGTAKVTGRVATFPIRRPIKSAKWSAYGQTPFIATSDNPLGELKRVLEGQGVAAGVLHGLGTTVAEASPSELVGNIAKDALDLPANAVPAIYLPVAGLIEAAQGDPDRLDKLWGDYKEIGLLPAVASGDPGKVLAAIKNHPLFTALEARGVQAGVGRSAGAIERRVRGGEQERPALEVGGGQQPYPRQYSRDLIEKKVQQALDRRRGRKRGGQVASVKERERILRERVDRLVGQEEGARRAGRTAEAVDALQSLKDVKLYGRRAFIRRGPKARAERDVGISLAAQGILRSPKTFRADLVTYAGKLRTAGRELQGKLRDATKDSAKADLRNRIKANQAMLDRVEQLKLKGDPEAIFSAARANTQGLRQIDKELEDLGLAPGAQLAQARMIPTARTHLEADYGISNETRVRMDELRGELEQAASPREAAAIRGKLAALSQRAQVISREGEALPPERLAEEIRQMGGDPEALGFVSQRPGARGAGSFFRGFWPETPSLAKAKRTGTATTEGTFDPSFDAIVEQRIRGRGIIDATRGFGRTVREFAAGGARYGNMNEALQAARRIEEETGVKLQPVRLTPLRATAEQTRRAEELFDTLDPSNQRGMESIVNRLLDDATSEGPGPVVLLPEQVVKRLGEHFQAATTTQRVAQVINQGFKGAVLPTSPNWLLGNIVDVNMRTALSGTTPFGFNAGLGRRIIREIERENPELAKRIRAGLVPGSVYGAADANRVFRDARQFLGTGVAPLARAMGTLRRTPGVKQVVNGYTKYRDAVFQFNSRFLEDQAFYAMLGKTARRDIRLRTGQWESALRVGDDAVRDLAKGLRETPAQIKYAKSIEETLGQWTANSPGARQFLVDYAPFAMWTRAATKFVLWTLPAKHPIKTAIAAAAYEMTEEERNQLGLSHFADEPVTPNLQGSIPLAGGGLFAPQSITSFGFFADYQQSLAQSILPQFDLDALRGLDWTGKKLTHADGTPLNAAERAVAAFLGTSEAYIPWLAMGKRVAKDGWAAAAPRTVRPYDGGLVEWLRKQAHSIEITVPEKGSGGGDNIGPSSAAPWNGGSGSSSGGRPWASPTWTAPWN